ncbi:MAG TPA: FxsA family protein [Solirubrobacteraceae bacterium]|nr:FxsA family protein [Solirubrobacteraceae bacterium]
MAFLFLLLLVAWPVAELIVFINVAQAIGVLDAFLLLIAAVPLGIWALRSQGRSAWRRLSTAVAERRTPTREVLDGTLVLIGGSLLMVPGFITDALGILLLLPPTRSLTRWIALRAIESRLMIQAVRFSTRGRRPDDVDSTATDIRPPGLQP